MKKRTHNILLLSTVFFSLLLMNCKIQQNNISVKGKSVHPIFVDFTPKDTSWKSLSIREKIGQTMIVRAYYDEHKKQFGSIENMLKKYPVGGIFVPNWMFINIKPENRIIPILRNRVQAYEDASKRPLIISEDFERGVGSVYKGFTHLPSLMSLGAANDLRLTEKFGNAIAKEASSLGINWLLHPVADLNIHPLQNLVLDRSFSDDAQKATPLIFSQIKGIEKEGVVATIKHFPGDGATMKNQHFVTSANNLSIKEWETSFGAMYQQLINNGVNCIMVGHIRFPAYQKEKIKGVYPPATLSKELLQDLLKKKMKFNGVVMSDALNMGGVAGYYEDELETSIEAFKAGVDMVLWPQLSYLDSVEVRIKRGEIPIERLDDAVKRIWGVRGKMELLKKKSSIFYSMTSSDIKEIKNTAKEVAEKGVTLLVDNFNEIPLSPLKTKKIAIVNLSHYDKTKELTYTQKLLKEKGFKVDVLLHNPSFFEWQNKLNWFKQFDKIIVAFENRYFNPLGASMLKDKEAMGLWTMGMLPQEKIIAISYSNPYYVNYYFDNASIRINAYSIDTFTQKAVVDALTGVIPFKGTSPVKLDHKVLR